MKNNLLTDIRRVIDAIDEEVDSYIGTFNADSEQMREMMKVAYKQKKMELKALTDEMLKKWKKSR